MITTNSFASGEMGQRIHAFDWSTTLLGPLDQWPQSQRIALASCLAVRLPTALWLGPELVLCYNDAWRTLVDGPGEGALGRAGYTVFADQWDIIGPALQQVFATGQAGLAHRVELIVQRSGFNEVYTSSWFISPIHDDAGQVVGLTTALVETPARTLGVAPLLGEQAPGRPPETLPEQQGRTPIEQAMTQLEAMLDHMPLGVAFFDRAFRCVRVNAEFVRIYGRAGDASIGQPIQTPLPHGTAAFRPQIEQVFATGVGTLNVEITGSSPTNSAQPRHLLASWYPVHVSGETVLVGAVVQDITERKRAEERVAHLQRMSEALAGAVTRHDVYKVIQQQTSAAFGVATVFVRVPSSDGAELVTEALRVDARQNEAATRAFVRLPLALPHPANDAFNSAQPVFLPDTATIIARYPNLTEVIAHTGAKAAMHLPLVRGGHVFGVISLAFNEAQFFREADHSFAIAFADRCAVALERAQLHSTLAASEQQMRLITDGVPVLISYIDHEGRYQFVNKTYTEWFNNRREAVIGHSMRTILGEAAYAAVKPEIDKALAGHEVTFERLVPYQRGGTRFVQATYMPDRAPDGTVKGFFALVVDLTERKRAEDNLRYQTRLLEALTESVLDGILIVSPAGGMLHYNQQFLDIWQFPPEVTASQSDERLLAWAAAQTADPAAFLARVGTIYGQKEGQFREELAMRDGRFYERFGAPIQDGATRLGWLWTFRDITQRKRADQAVREAQGQRLAEEQQHAERLRQLNAAALAINAATTRDEVLRLITGEARTIIGAHQAITSTTTDQNWARALTAVSVSEKYARWKEYAIRPDGSGIYALVCQTNKPMRLTQTELEAHPAWSAINQEAAHHPPMRGWLASPLIGLDGRNIGLIQLSDKETGEFTVADESLLAQLAQLASLALENQTLYEQEQAARAQAEQASRLKDEFLATVSHELRTPLTAFLGYAQLLQSRKRDEAYIARTLEKMVRSAKSQAQLIEDLLDIAQIVSGRLRIEPTAVDLASVVRAALDTVRPAVDVKGIQIVLELSPDASALIGDAGRLQQVVWNLLSNATKFTPAGGTITVRLEPDDHDAVLSVRDTGQGISAAFLPYVFDRFRQADGTTNRANGGLGIGLAIVQHLVELHGGRVQVQSDGLGLGATFTVRLPRTVRATTPVRVGAVFDTPDATDECPPELAGLRVLVVDDQPELLELLEEILAPCGTLVRACSNAHAALAAVRSWQPQVLVSDIAMPGADGYWLIAQVRALAPEEGGTVPAIALTAYVRMEDRLRVLAAGFEQYVPKPVEPSELRAVVAHLAQPAALE